MRTLLSFMSLPLLGLPAMASSSLVYFGTYTGPKSQGVYVARFDSATGKLETPRLAGEVKNPSWVTIHPSGRFLYAVTEVGNDGKSEAPITSFAIDGATGMLRKLNDVSSGGGGACHLAIDKGGRSLSVAHYGSGSVAVFQLRADGSIGARTALIQHSGKSVDQRRQRGPHAHAVVISPDQRFLFVPDLGLDKVMSYRLDAAAGTLAANDPPFASVKPGLGPRHFAFHPNGKFAYGLNEMGSSVTAFAYDTAQGALNEIQTISNLPASFTGENNSAEIDVDRAGRFVYASNRGDDSITVYAVGKDGMLTLVEKVATQGKTPRGFKLDPSGRYLLVGNQNTGNVVILKVDRKTGKLTATGATVELAAPVCVQFLTK